MRAGILKMPVRIANRDYPDQTSEGVWSGSALFVLFLVIEILENLP